MAECQVMQEQSRRSFAWQIPPVELPLIVPPAKAGGNHGEQDTPVCRNRLALRLRQNDWQIGLDQTKGKRFYIISRHPDVIADAGRRGK